MHGTPLCASTSVIFVEHMLHATVGVQVFRGTRCQLMSLPYVVEAVVAVLWPNICDVQVASVPVCARCLMGVFVHTQLTMHMFADDCQPTG